MWGGHVGWVGREPQAPACSHWPHEQTGPSGRSTGVGSSGTLWEPPGFCWSLLKTPGRWQASWRDSGWNEKRFEPRVEGFGVQPLPGFMAETLAGHQRPELHFLVCETRWPSLSCALSAWGCTHNRPSDGTEHTLQ